jgi:hypothetical protein
MEATKVAVHATLRIVAFLLANDDAVVLANFSKASYNGGIIAEIAVAMQLMERAAYAFNDIDRVWPIRVAANSHSFPWRK